MNHLSKKCLVWTITGAVIIAIAFFFIGDAVGKHAVSSSPSKYGGSAMMRGGMAGGMRSRAGNSAFGTILSFDATSITIATQGGGSKTILISPTTSILKSTAGTQGDLTTGTTVIVNGTPNADGSISASTVSIRPAGSGPMGGAPTPTPAASGTSNQ